MQKVSMPKPSVAVTTQQDADGCDWITARILMSYHVPALSPSISCEVAVAAAEPSPVVYTFGGPSSKGFETSITYVK